MRVIGLDVHRSFAQVAELENGVLRQCGRVDLVRDKVLAFARTLRFDDEVVLEATGNTRPDLGVYHRRHWRCQERQALGWRGATVLRAACNQTAVRWS